MDSRSWRRLWFFATPRQRHERRTGPIGSVSGATNLSPCGRWWPGLLVAHALVRAASPLLATPPNSRQQEAATRVSLRHAGVRAPLKSTAILSRRAEGGKRRRVGRLKIGRRMKSCPTSGVNIAIICSLHRQMQKTPAFIIGRSSAQILKCLPTTSICVEEYHSAPVCAPYGFPNAM